MEMEKDELILNEWVTSGFIGEAAFLLVLQNEWCVTAQSKKE